MSSNSRPPRLSPVLTQKYRRTVRIGQGVALLYFLLRVVSSLLRWTDWSAIPGGGFFTIASITPLISSLVAVGFGILVVLAFRKNYLTRAFLILSVVTILLAILEFSTGAGGFLEFIVAVIAQRAWAASRSEYFRAAE